MADLDRIDGATGVKRKDADIGGGYYAPLEASIEVPRSAWSESADSSANAQQTVTHAAEASKRHYITGYLVTIKAANAGGDIAIELRDGATVKWRDTIGSGALRGERVGMVFEPPLECAVNSAVNLVIPAGGTSVVSSGSVTGYTI